MSEVIQKKSKLKNFDYVVYPLAFIICIIPLIVHLKVMSLDWTPFKSWQGSKYNYDFFSYYKAVFLIIGALAAVFLCLFKLKKIKFKLKNRIYNYLILSYAVLIILSGLTSEYITIGLFGICDRYEGMFVLLMYLIIFFIAINFIDNEKHVKIIIGSLFVSAFIIGLIGIFQFFGYHFFNTQLGKLIMMPWSLNINVKLKYNYNNKLIASTLYNPNYVGSYMAMLVPLSISIFLFCKKRSYKILMEIFSLLMLANLFGCNSRAGLVGTIAAVIILLIISRKQLTGNLSYIISYTLIGIIMFLGMNHYSSGTLSNKFGTVKSSADADTRIELNNQLEDININKNEIIVKTLKNPIRVLLEKNNLKICDLNNNILNTKNYNNKLVFTDKQYKDYSFVIIQKDKRTIIEMDYLDMVVNFEVLGGEFKIVGLSGTAEDLIHPPTFGFKGKEGFGSARGYIWSRTIPLLKYVPVKGYGPDTFILYFPQYDYVGKLKAYQTMNIIVDKPHNMYLQIAMNTGVLSLIILLVLFVIYFVRNFKLYSSKTAFNGINKIGIGIYAAFIGYAIAAVFNDSAVSVAPVFWILIGLGININTRMSEKVENS